MSQDRGSLDVGAVSQPKQFVPYNGKIADITHADTLKHFLTLTNGLGTGAIAGETGTIVSILLGVKKITGTGLLRFYPNEGTDWITIEPSDGINWYNTEIAIKAGTNRLQYSLSVANDDFDLSCFGYILGA